MKATVADIRLAKQSIAYRLVKEVIEGAKEIRPAKITGSGRYVNVQDNTLKVSLELTRLGIGHRVENDAPRGGIAGNKIIIL